MQKVLILSAAFGDGHNTAAQNIREALELISDDVKVEVLDLLETGYGSIYTIAQKAHLKVVRYAPSVWSTVYSLLDKSSLLGRNLGRFSKLQSALALVLSEAQPDCVVSTYPLYGHIIRELYQEDHARPFRFITVITDSISVNSAWFGAPSDFFCVANAATAEVLRAAKIAKEIIKPLGFPVSPLFAEAATAPLEAPEDEEPIRILYIINCGKRKAGKAIDRLLAIPRTRLTITVGRDAGLKAKLIERTRKMAHRVRVLGWTNQMPHLMLANHLVIGKAGGATVQEAIAARCPMIINQIIPGQEEGNARLIEEGHLGGVAGSNRQVAELVKQAFVHGARLWRVWRENLTKVSKPNASLEIAELILSERDPPDPGGKKIRLFERDTRQIMGPAARPGGEPKMLLCDFHIHTNYSDGRLTAPEVVDFYGKLGFDCICITDHLADPRRLIGKMTELCNFTLGPDQVEEYFAVLERERQRAWRKYKMIVMTGIEFNKDGYTKKSSAHLLGIDLKAPINPALELPEIISEIHHQGGLAVASHPHKLQSEWGKHTLYLWENQKVFAPLLDAWEIANRNNIFNSVGKKRLPFIANSDFHKPKHIYSWKTLLHCQKDAEAIKWCVRENQDVAITLFRDASTAKAMKRAFEEKAAFGEVIYAQADLPLRAINR